MAVGFVHRGEHFHRRDEVVFALRDELGGVEDVGLEQLNFVAAQLVDMLAANGRRRLRQDLHLGAVNERAGFFE